MNGWTRSLGRHAAWIAAALAVLAYLGTLGHGFALDDVHQIERNPLIRSLGSAGALFGTSWWGWQSEFGDQALYRPLTTLGFALQHALHGTAPFGYHLVNVALHAAASALLVLLVRRLFGASLAGPRLALWSGVLFALHPVHVEAVAGIVGRADVQAAIGVLAACLAWDAARARDLAGQRVAALLLGLAALAACALGAFSKEIGVVAPGAIVLQECLFRQHRWLLARRPLAWILALGLVLVLLAYFLLRAQATAPVTSAIGLTGLPAEQRVPTALWVALRSSGLLVLPWTLVADVTPREVPIAQGWFDPRGLAGALWLLALAAAAFAARRTRPAITWGLALAALAWLPGSNLLIGIGVIQAERLLYTPSTGTCVALAAAALWLGERTRAPRAAALGLALLAACYLGRTLLRVPDWRDSITLGLATLEVAPESSVTHEMLADTYYRRGEWERAREHARTVVRLNDRPEMHALQGDIERGQGRPERALEHYRAALERHPTLAPAWNNLGLALADLGRADEALEAFARLRAADPREGWGWTNALSVLLEAQRLPQARVLAEEAAERFPADARVLWAASVVLRHAGEQQRGAALGRRALELDPTAADPPR